MLQLWDTTQVEEMGRHLQAHPELDLRVVTVRTVPGGAGVLLHLARDSETSGAC